MIVVLLALGLLPLWYVALASGSSAGAISLGTETTPVAVNASAHAFAPTQRFLTSAPIEVGTTQAGVVTWVALLGLVAALVLSFRFIDRLGGRGTTDMARSGPTSISVPSFLVKEDRRILEYIWPPATRAGLLAIGALTWAAFVLTSLLIYEDLTLARTQFLGLYLGGLLLTLALIVVVYAAYFVPHISVIERREHATEHES